MGYQACQGARDATAKRLANRKENAVGFFIKLIREGEKKNAELFGGFKKAFQLKKSNLW